MTEKITSCQIGPYATTGTVSDDAGGFESEYAMTIPGHGTEDGTTLEWVVQWVNATSGGTTHILTATTLTRFVLTAKRSW
jgi:hypothetical protein